jgi:transposase
MTLCLLIYAILERKIRTILTTVALFFKNQLGKDTQKPTANWIFQSFVGIHVLQINEKNKLILNIKQARRNFYYNLEIPTVNIIKIHKQHN